MKKKKENKSKRVIQTVDLADYNKSTLTKGQLIGVRAVFTLIATAVLYIFYRNIIISFIFGFFVAPYFVDEFKASGIKKRKKRLRSQFCDMLESMSVASRAGNNELKSLEAAYSDLKMTYNDQADIIREMKNIIEKNRNGITLRALFKDFGIRSGIEDIKSFGEIYEIIEGRSDRFSDIIKQTQQIISDKIEIEQEIETVLTAPKNDCKMMLFMPVLLVLLLGAGGGGFLAPLFEELWGRAVMTICVGIYIAAYFVGQKMTDIEV